LDYEYSSFLFHWEISSAIVTWTSTCRLVCDSCAHSVWESGTVCANENVRGSGVILNHEATAIALRGNV
jgi:hypothetical protein